MVVKLAYLGPEGTYTEQAAVEYSRIKERERIAYPAIPLVIDAAERGEVEEAIVPIENSLEGAVTFTVDLLIHRSALKIRREVVVPIHHCLLARPGTLMEDARVVYSHPQALAQCRSYIHEKLPNAQQVASLSTAAAVGDMLSGELPAVAISSRRAAEIFGAAVLDADIEDVPNNQTRFVALARSDHPRTGRDKTSICFDFGQDRPGALYGVLGELAKRDINMAKIESRPDRRSLGRYVFMIDMAGHREDAVVRDALEGIRAQTSLFKALGSYPVWG